MATKILKRKKIITKMKGYKIPPVFQFRAEILSSKHKISITAQTCKRCELYLKPKECVEFINKNSPILPGVLPFFALGLRYDMSGDYHRCFHNKNTKPELWSSSYGIEKIKGAVSKKAVEVFEELKPFLDAQRPDGSYNMKYITEKELFMKGLRADVIRKTSEGKWVIVKPEGGIGNGHSHKQKSRQKR